jgi:hypothetical protein
MTSTTRGGAAVHANGVRAAETKILPSASKPMTLELGTTQRRSPPADKKNLAAAAAPRERRIFTTSEGVGFKTANPLSDQAT